ncbi:hypothetical protein GCM10007079_03500 [Nocardiopsis terrae]|uniref:Alkylation response protein AidB-like acyl-CoA dehydrogenase n=1 Tax=Nocardiopsis terrae TaxID=372655 RepID=A0ABR9HMZ9_9ACTN|nr:alkylation response protein AidB-like acyl-CoA dehydrogenase [Nocardiopsis terrae]GHC71272.1 hypothetical protein GCM10007079_03500 [Nocardiopsis terrae]
MLVESGNQSVPTVKRTAEARRPGPPAPRGHRYRAEDGLERIVCGLRAPRILEGTTETMSPIIARRTTGAAG